MEPLRPWYDDLLSGALKINGYLAVKLTVLQHFSALH